MVSRYRILGQLGQGGMGVVYRAEDTRLNRPVALKFLPPDSLTEHDHLRFLNEARAAAAIGHPNICAIYDVEEVDGRIFIAMAYIEGMTLSKKLAGGALDIREAARLGAQIAAGLDAAHRMGIVHRDIKGGNVVVTEDGHACILDFGLALRPGATRLTVAGGALGTPAYMSPEQALGKEVDFRSDIWSLGVLLFEMVTGVLPFRREHQSAVIYAIVHDAPPSVASLRPAAPPELRRVIERALRKEPSERWGSAKEMAEELRKISGDSLPRLVDDPDVTRTLGSGQAVAPAASPRKRSPWLKVAVLTLALGSLAGGGGYWLLRSPPLAVEEAAPDAGRVAVLPFHAPPGDKKLATLADGMMEVLTGALSDKALFHGKITAVPSSEVRRRANTMADARRVYGITLAVSGNVKQTGQTVEVTLELTDAVKSRSISTRTVAYDPARPVETKREMVAELARMLNFELTPIERTAITVGDSSAPAAYGAYLEGRGLLARYDVEGNVDKAIAAFQGAIAKDPNYALAHAGLAEGYWRKLRGTHEKNMGDLAVASAEKAVRLDPTLAVCQAILGQIYATVGKQQEGIAHLSRAIEIAPASAEAPRQLAQIFSEMGRVAEAEASYVSSTKARPTDWYGFLLLGIFYIQQQRWADAEKALRQAQTLTPDNDLVSRNLGALYARQGQYAYAEKELQRTLALNPKSSLAYAILASVLFLQHRYQQAVDAVEGAIDLDPLKANLWGNLGIYSKWAPGSEGKAAAALRKAVEMTEKSLSAIPDDYNSRANLAEYHARLKEFPAAFADLSKIPPAARKPVATRFVIVYELAGRRRDAIAAVRDYITTPEAMRQIRDDPDLAALWSDTAFQKAIPAGILKPGN